MSFASNVYGRNMTETEARRQMGGVVRGKAVAPRASQPKSSALRVSSAIFCDGCGRETKTGVVVPGVTALDEPRWLCSRSCR